MMLSHPSSLLLGKSRSLKASSHSVNPFPRFKPSEKVFQLKMAYENQYQQVSTTRYECLLFDLDDTIYAPSTGLSKPCSKNIEEYMVQKLGMEESQVSKINRVLYRNYGTSLAGLKAIGYDFDDDDYHSSVHGRLPYENLKPDPVLRNLLLSLPIRKVIFTNADKVHVDKVLEKLGLKDCFEEILNFESLNYNDKTMDLDDKRDWTIETLDETYSFDGEKEMGCEGSFSIEVLDGAYAYDDQGDLVFKGLSNQILDPSQSNAGFVIPKTPIVCKPSEDAFKQAFRIANINPGKTLFFDDSIRNIETGKKLGLHTVLYGNRWAIPVEQTLLIIPWRAFTILGN